MPTPSICPSCHVVVAVPPADGRCPACGSKVVGETPPGGNTTVDSVVEQYAGVGSALGASTLGLVPVNQQAATKDFAPALDSATNTFDDTHAYHPKAPPGPAPVLANYIDLRYLGGGGMGTVYRGIQRKTERVVAIKFLNLGGAHDPILRARFDSEAKALASIEHPHVTAIYEVGEENGRPFFSMEYLPGTTLAGQVKDGPLEPRVAAEWIVQAAHGVQAAHNAGILHRDLKPGNILLTADGRAKVADYGLARFGDGDFTPTSAILGTPSYMAPEQAAGKTKELDARTDVYGLAATLYTLLTKKPPFKKDSDVDTMKAVQQETLKPPAVHTVGLPRDLEAVCLKGLEKDPAKRYTTAAAFAEDLSRWLRGEPTVARPLTRWCKVKRDVRRHGWKVAAAGVVLIAMGAGFVAANPKWQIDVQMAVGRPVVLIGPQGQPRWSEFLIGQSVLQNSKDGSTMFRSDIFTLLALAEVPKNTNYRFTAEIRHLGGARSNMDDEFTHGGDGKVGVFWGYDHQKTKDQSDIHTIYTLEYNDFMPLNWPVDKTPVQKISAELRTVSDIPDLSMPKNTTKLIPHKTFQPVRVTPGRWRKIVIEVYRDRFVISWVPEPDTDVTVIGTVSDGLLRDRIRIQQLAQSRQSPLGEVTIRDWHTEGYIGIFAMQASVAIRNVQLVPNIN